MDNVERIAITLPAALAMKMRHIWKARRYAEGFDPTLSRIYREAAELYVQTIHPDTGRPKGKKGKK